MPPRGKLTEEQKQEAFTKWKGEQEFASIMNFQAEINKLGEKKKGALELSDVDLCVDIQQYLNVLFLLVQDLKTPGRKAKEYQQMFCRTMFWVKFTGEGTPFVTIDGVKYEYSNNAGQDSFKCKEAIYEIQAVIDSQRMDMELDPETMVSWKKELIKFCKEWDKLYVKHAKAVYPEINAIHVAAMKPLTQLIEANSNFHKLEIMIKEKKQVPEFRRLALEAEFCKFLTGVCDIFKEFGELKDHFDIKQMLKVLKIENWESCPPFKFYLQPLADAIMKVRKNLLQMEKDGHLFIKYVIEENKQLQADTIDMVKQDGTAQWLVGDELKQDQFRFFYDTAKIIYDSAVQNKLLSADQTVLESIIPKLVAFRSVMNIRNIQLRKAAEFRKIKEKAELNGVPAAKIQKDPMHMTPDELTAYRMEQAASGENTGITKSEAQLELEHEEEERKRYGRFWIWDGYYNEKNKEKWLECAEQLKHINDHVIQDIEDCILLEAFKGLKANKVAEAIQIHEQDRIQNEKKLMPKDGEAFEEKALLDMKKRKFMNEIRPPMYWNFFEDGPQMSRVKHVLRHNAKPTECYSDGRVEKILTTIEEIGMNLRKYEESKWAMLMKQTIKIFEDQNKQYKQQLADAA